MAEEVALVIEVKKKACPGGIRGGSGENLALDLHSEKGSGREMSAGGALQKEGKEWIPPQKGVMEESQCGEDRIATIW